MHGFVTIKDIVEQLEKCQYEDNIGHKLEMNAAFCRLREIAELNYQPKYQLNEKVVHDGKFRYISGISVASQSHPDTEVMYSLSAEHNHQSTTNQSCATAVKERNIITDSEYLADKVSAAKSLLVENGYVLTQPHN